VTVAFGAFIVAWFVAALCQASLVGGAAVIALMVTAAWLAKGPR
jgi:hypothetical protein